ncbi:P-loop containing nucleoside triphosphate hydrolase protein [Fusarium acuminatum]|uniref:P-loop containing nucleoside triphosphate hydrolase protein n=1 Tax=Fusarium acuminatum TaxID=5515 RepID=A0ABZ2WQ78_9HYPO
MDATTPPIDGPDSLGKNTIQTPDGGSIKIEEVPLPKCASMGINGDQDTEMEGSTDIVCESDKERSAAAPSMSSAEPTKPIPTTQVKQECADDVLKKPIKQEVNPEITAKDFLDQIAVEVDSEVEDDPDFSPEDQSESDDSDDVDAKEKRHKSKIRAKESSKVSSILEALTNERNGLIVREVMGEILSNDERQKLKEVKIKIENIQQSISANSTSEASEIKPKVKRFLAKTAREYWQHVAEGETQEDDKKRKFSNDKELPMKSRKTQAQSHPGGALDSLQPSKPTEHGDSEPATNTIKATTHAAQFEQIMAGIPEEFDTRRTATQAKDMKSAPKSFGYKKVKAINGRWLLKGMTTPLMSYQLVASSWMIMREAKGLHPPGGLLADDMGLGKTITCIATIVGHPPDEEDIAEFCKATLIIADGPQAAKQLYSQVEQHGTKKLADFTEVYTKTGRRRDWWERRRVIIATYYDLLAQFPSKKVYKELKGKWAGDEVGFRMALRGKLGPIFRTNYYRIILDEAHAIKNHESSTTRACWELQAKYKWVVSGTPLSNSVMEFYPYLKFIGSHFAYSRKIFSDQYVKSEDSVKNFEALASMIMYRRKQDDMFLRERLVNLPMAHSHDLWVPLLGWEAILNKVVDDCFKAELLEKEEDDTEEDEFNDLDDESNKSDVNDDQGQDADGDEDDIQMEDVGTIVDAQTAFKLQTSRLTRLRQLSSHPFNLEPFLREKDREAEIQLALDKFRAEMSETTANTDQQELDMAIGSQYSLGLKQLEENTQGLFGGIGDMEKMLTLAINEQKSQEITCRLCDQENPPVEPTRSSNCEQVYCRRCLQLAVHGYKRMKKSGQSPEVTSMRCGGQSLNLQVANRAIILDIWFNKTVEDQAFKRVYRFGQKKETYLVRIMANGSIDERVSSLQEAKEAIIATALQDDGHIPKFSNKMQLEMLFSTKDTESLIRDMSKAVREQREQQKMMDKGPSRK